jgi:hypothetical protein
MDELAHVKELAAAADFFAVLGTTRTDGTVHASLVKAGVLDDPYTGEASVGIVVGNGARKLESPAKERPGQGHLHARRPLRGHREPRQDD